MENLILIAILLGLAALAAVVFTGRWQLALGLVILAGCLVMVYLLLPADIVLRLREAGELLQELQ